MCKICGGIPLGNNGAGAGTGTSGVLGCIGCKCKGWNGYFNTPVLYIPAGYIGLSGTGCRCVTLGTIGFTGTGTIGTAALTGLTGITGVGNSTGFVMVVSGSTGFISGFGLGISGTPYTPHPCCCHGFNPPPRGGTLTGRGLYTSGADGLNAITGRTMGTTGLKCGFVEIGFHP